MRCLLEGDPEGMSQRDLTAAMSSDPNTVASLLERMEANGWIDRRVDESDRRAYRLRLRPAGETKYQKVRDIAVALQLDILGVLPEDEREHFLENLERVSEACRDAAARTPRSGR